MSLLSVLGDDAKADAIALWNSFAQDDLGKIAMDVVTVVEDGAQRIIDPADQAQLDAAEVKLLNDAEDAGIALATLVKADLQYLIGTAVQAATAALVSSAVAAAV